MKMNTLITILLFTTLGTIESNKELHFKSTSELKFVPRKPFITASLVQCAASTQVVANPHKLFAYNKEDGICKTFNVRPSAQHYAKRAKHFFLYGTKVTKKRRQAENRITEADASNMKEMIKHLSLHAIHSLQGLTKKKAADMEKVDSYFRNLEQSSQTGTRLYCTHFRRLAISIAWGSAFKRFKKLEKGNRKYSLADFHRKDLIKRHYFTPELASNVYELCISYAEIADRPEKSDQETRNKIKIIYDKIIHGS